MQSANRRQWLYIFIVATTYWCAVAFTTQVRQFASQRNSRKPSVLLLASSDSSEVNGSSNGLQAVSPSRESQEKLPGLHLSPYHLLQPAVLSQKKAPLNVELPLRKCLSLLKDSLRKLSTPTTKQTMESRKVIRIEHKLSHDIDLLCWLQAQNQANNLFNHPSTYFATDDDAFEAATFGSTTTFKGTSNDDRFWNLVQTLPGAAHLYGGNRFDEEAPISSEWAPFSNGLWILPAIELRRERDEASKKDTTTISVHVVEEDGSFSRSASHLLEILDLVSDDITEMVPPKTLPPVLSRTNMYNGKEDGQELYEKGVAAAIDEFQRADSDLEKVVLARRMDLLFAKEAKDINSIDVLKKWKFALKPGGHMFYINPGWKIGREFFGCTPERLFRVDDGTVTSEALAGTRPRGSTQKADNELAQQLFESDKDKSENLITGNFIRETMCSLEEDGLLTQDSAKNGTALLIRRLRHLQHICQQYDAKIPNNTPAWKSIRALLGELHPTPALGGSPQKEAMEFIRRYETVGFDRGLYGGPVGFIGRERAEIVVAIRSGLMFREGDGSSGAPQVSVYAGAGLVPGSTIQSEWSETAYKLEVVSSIFPQSPMTLQGAPTPNVAWANAFIEELIRSGVSKFYICPGSRSTPLVSAIARAMRVHAGLVDAVSIHDERGACFRAMGYGRGSGTPAAVVTSSGTAVANLYPAIIEASAEGIPLLLLTADRPYESRGTGANQAIDQVKIFPGTDVRWFRDVLPPSDDVPVAAALADASHAVHVAKKLSGPVHMNIQFRENLAPDAGPVRNDERTSSMTNYDSVRFTETPGFNRWSLGGAKWMKTYSKGFGTNRAIGQVAELISNSRRGMIVIGNIRQPTDSPATIDYTVRQISSLAEATGFPIFSSALFAQLRFESPAVVPFAENILRCKSVAENINPDLVLQFGAPMISTEIPKVLKRAIYKESIPYIIVHPHQTTERADPDFTITHQVDSDISPFVGDLMQFMDEMPKEDFGSELSGLIQLGREVQRHMPGIIADASDAVRDREESEDAMSEPEVMMAISRVLGNNQVPDLSLFLSNSMPIRDAESFLYPIKNDFDGNSALKHTAVNRGASGIDGIIASATGFSDATSRPTTLVVGDVAALHDINSLHSIDSSNGKHDSSDKKTPPLTIIVVNNDGGGIFSFLPIAAHGSDVNFDEFFGTPTNSFSFERGAEAFSLPFKQATNISALEEQYLSCQQGGETSLIEAVVASREQNVAVHREITQRVNKLIEDFLAYTQPPDTSTLPTKTYLPSRVGTEAKSQTLVLLHGWMGDKSEWDQVASYLMEKLPPDWSVVSVDLPCHGESPICFSDSKSSATAALGLQEPMTEMGLDTMGDKVLETLHQMGIEAIDAIAGYSLGGRVALAMKNRALSVGDTDGPTMISQDTNLILLSAFPGEFRKSEDSSEQKIMRLRSDEALRGEMLRLSRLRFFQMDDIQKSLMTWSDFLQEWYEKPMWGDILNSREVFADLVERRSRSLSYRGKDIAEVLVQCSPARSRDDLWRHVQPEKTLFVSGEYDVKYTSIGKDWASLEPSLNLVSLANKGHALLVEAPSEVAELLSSFLVTDVADESIGSRGNEKVLPDSRGNVKVLPDRSSSAVLAIDDKKRLSPEFDVIVSSFDYEKFSIGLVDDRGRRKSSIIGIGWGEKANANDVTRHRNGLIIQITSDDGMHVGIGEVSPLQGLHPESLDEAISQVDEIRERLDSMDSKSLPTLNAEDILNMAGAIQEYLQKLGAVLEIPSFLRSVQAGLEMAVLSVASQTVKKPIYQALVDSSTSCDSEATTSNPSLALNGLITRASAPLSSTSGPSFEAGDSKTKFESWKVKVGHQSVYEDAMAISYACQVANAVSSASIGRTRADANRGFNATTAFAFANLLKNSDMQVLDSLEYVEEPLQRVVSPSDAWSIEDQINTLEEWHTETGISYALDESVSDLVEQYGHDFNMISNELKNVLSSSSGCAALILKPSLLGLELSLRLAVFARAELGVGAVFTSSFDSGVGLAFISFLASISDGSPATGNVQNFAHGLGTFDMLESDCISPTFGSYVSKDGRLNVASLSRAFYGFGLDEVESLSFDPLPAPTLSSTPPLTSEEDQVFNSVGVESLGEFEASTSTSKDGREINVVASLPLPFSADIASSRFTDLPQQPRWSPWITSVAYVESRSETEWNLQVRGIQFRWRALSFLLDKPYRGIRWESVSGVKNTGAVEFIPTDDGNETCMMKVQIAFVAPRVLAPLFRGTSVFFEDFIRNKVLKWSLEMFRDVVKGDLVLEEGNIELGDALFAAVEGKANAIEATLANPIRMVERPEDPTE